ncbi:unnamed protein product [Discosporangium mesarthrocarpum]
MDSPPCQGMPCDSSAPPPKKKIIVIGAGASGLTVMKELTALGHKVVCFEKLPVIGGVYAKSYDNTMLTSSSCLTAFSDYSNGLEHRPKFWTDAEYLEYLHGYADKFDLKKHILFRTRVEKLQRCGKSGKWTVWYKRNRYSPPHRAYEDVPEEQPQEPVVEEGGFDGVAICTGTNNFASLPCFKGEETFKGEIIHSENYRRPESFAGKRVLIIGSGESGSDICNEISRHASATGISIRTTHGHLIPRKQGGGRVTDLNTNRCRYSIPYLLGDWVGFFTMMAKGYVASCGAKTLDNLVLQKLGELNMKQGTSAFSKFGCKNAGFVEAIVQRGASLHRGAFELREASALILFLACVQNKAVFADGSEFECDTVVACTGYKNYFPFVQETHPDIDTFGRQPRMLLQTRVFHPNYNGEVAYFGFARPAFGSIPPCSEMQSRYYAMVLNGDLELPCKKEMIKTADEDQADWEWRFGYDAKRITGLVDFALYCDDLGALIGASPPLWKIFFSKPKLWFSIMFGPFTMHQYRLVGPFANPEVAAKVYERQPLGDLLESSITVSFLFTAKVLSMLGFRNLKPNRF